MGAVVVDHLQFLILILQTEETKIRGRSVSVSGNIFVYLREFSQ